ncbi:hypothetical protein GCM10023238_02090 [Streptomyces heliomycini]
MHLVCASLWAGGLLYALRTLRLWRRAEAGAALLGRYARVAAVLLAAVHRDGRVQFAAPDAAETVLEQLTDTAYGRVLLAKVILMTGSPSSPCGPDPAGPREGPADRLLPRAGGGVRARRGGRGVGAVTALPVPIRW